VNDDQHLIRDERDEPLEMTSRMISSFSEVEARPSVHDGGGSALLEKPNGDKLGF